jgi:hypothetical protein
MNAEIPVVIVVKMFRSNGNEDEAIRKQVTKTFINPEAFFGEREICLFLRLAVEKKDVAKLIEAAMGIEGVSYAYPSHDWTNHDCQVALMRDGLDLFYGT